jgi:hypothetical protein
MSWPTLANMLRSERNEILPSSLLLELKLKKHCKFNFSLLFIPRSFCGSRSEWIFVRWRAKIEKSKEFFYSEVLNVLFLRAEGFSCSLNIIGIFFSCKISQFLVINTLDMDPNPH